MIPVQTNHTHGVFINIFGIGVLLTGESGCGKSEIALTLIDRGHQLIADDICEFTIVEGKGIVGSAPALLKNFLEVRGLGIFNILQLFGAEAVKDQQILSLIIHLKKTTIIERKTNHSITDHKLILDTAIPCITLPYVTPRNFENLIEISVRNFLMNLHGHQQSFDLIQQPAVLG